MDNQGLLPLVHLSVQIGQNRSNRFEPVRGQPYIVVVTLFLKTNSPLLLILPVDQTDEVKHNIHKNK